MENIPSKVLFHSYRMVISSIPISKRVNYAPLSYDVVSGSEIRSCNKIDKPLVLYRCSGKVMTSTTALDT